MELYNWIELIGFLNKSPIGHEIINNVNFIKIIEIETDRGHGYTSHDEVSKIVLFDGRIINIPTNYGGFGFSCDTMIKFCKIFGFVPAHYEIKIKRDGDMPVEFINYYWEENPQNIGHETNYIVYTKFHDLHLI